MKLRNKAALYPNNQGYHRRVPPKQLTLILHSTNGKIGSRFEDEEDFLFRSTKVSSHYLIGKSGNVTCFFDNVLSYAAWHAGDVIDEKYSNQNSIGIECHYSPGEPLPQTVMTNSLRTLLKQLCTAHHVIDICAHRYVAKPKGRKSDPNFLTDEQIELIRQEMLYNASIPILYQKNTSIDGLRDKLRRKGVLTYEIDPIVSAYTTFGELTNMGNVYPLAQWAHETGWGISDRWRSSRNPAGLGATNDGAWGEHFSTISEGILAQYAHLLCYATKPNDNTYIIEQIAQLSPRRIQMEQKFGRGSAPYWEMLNGKWAYPGTTYAQSIFEIASYLTS